MKVEAAFIFVAPNTDMNRHKSDISTDILNLHVVGVSNYAEGTEVAVKLVDEGVAVITRAVHGRARVGAVKFDCHPGLDFKSGDELFA